MPPASQGRASGGRAERGSLGRMAKRTKRSAIVPKIVRNTIAVGVIPTFAATAGGCAPSQLAPVVAAMGPEYGPALPPVVAAMVPEQEVAIPQPEDAGGPDAQDAQAGPTPDPTPKAR